MRWFRFYSDVLDDPKVQHLSPELFKVWVNLLCLANESEPRGFLPPVTDVAFRLRVNERKAASLIRSLREEGLFDDDGETLRPHNWDGRQRRSDDIAERVQKHRGVVTRNVTCNVTEPVAGNVTCNADVTVARATDQTRLETEETRPEPTAVAGAPAPVTEHAYDVYAAYCDEFGQPPEIPPPSKQLGIAKHILALGYTVGDVRGCIGFIRSETWRTGLIDLATVEDRLPVWRTNGRPGAASARASPNGSRRSGPRPFDPDSPTNRSAAERSGTQPEERE